MKIKKIESINVIPFIDIMLVLLAIVLTTATFIAKGSIKVDLPEASAGPQKIDKPLHVTINTKGEVFIKDTLVEKERLLESLRNTPKETTIVINGDKGMEYRYFVSTIDTLTSGGYTHLSIASTQEH